MRRGRPRKIVDEKRVIELAAKGYTFKEIAAFEDVSYSTLHRNFGRACEKGKLLCDAAIRAKQVERALAGSDMMLIWLGKQMLGQRSEPMVGKC
jgi:transposase